jgi:hypothetical protein
MNDFETQMAAAADGADRKRFGPPSAEFDLWCGYAAWTPEEAVALSIARDPAVISPDVITRQDLLLHHQGISLKDAPRLSRVARLYMDRYRSLSRAIRHGELPSTSAHGGYEIKPGDFLEWCHSKKGLGPWAWLPPDMKEQIQERRLANADPANVANTGKGNAAGIAKEDAGSSAGVEEGTQAAFEWLKSHLSGPAPLPDFGIQKQYQAYCKQHFKIGPRPFGRAWKKAIEETNCAWIKPGRPRKSKVNQ